MTKSGGDYIYLKDTFGSLIGFLFAWISVLVLRTSSLAIIALSFGTYAVSAFFESDCSPSPYLVKLMAAVCISEYGEPPDWPSVYNTLPDWSTMMHSLIDHPLHAFWLVKLGTIAAFKKVIYPSCNYNWFHWSETCFHFQAAFAHQFLFSQFSKFIIVSFIV